ncbi:MAG: peroxiredoxin [Alphaproteobacteria bacterium]|nr:peroxiredoxin [Alphaproteobacteria bacterium]
MHMKKISAFAALALCALFSLNAMAADMPKAGAAAPAFSLKNQHGDDISFAHFKKKWIVLYFYPKDFTQGCSLEAHNFQEDEAKYTEKNAVILGVSTDSPDSHKEFCAKEGLNFMLLADTDKKVSEVYGSIMDLGLTTVSARHTFIIDPQGIIRKTYDDVDPASHSEEVLADLAVLQAK